MIYFIISKPKKSEKAPFAIFELVADPEIWWRWGWVSRNVKLKWPYCCECKCHGYLLLPTVSLGVGWGRQRSSQDFGTVNKWFYDRNLNQLLCNIIFKTNSFTFIP